jgi:hypothetical protein
MLYPEQQSKGNQEDAVSGTVFAHWRSGDCGRVTGNPEVISSPVGLVTTNAHVFNDTVPTEKSVWFFRVFSKASVTMLHALYW